MVVSTSVQEVVLMRAQLPENMNEYFLVATLFVGPHEIHRSVFRQGTRSVPPQVDLLPNIVFVVLDLLSSHSSASVQVAVTGIFGSVNVFSMDLSQVNNWVETCSPGSQMLDF